ncbi:MAG TPA: hypothetical protein VFW05_13860 [Verrucomicrobiae bacterium]|nr:hypothetical protein [Verrucomicrobiae bacterium]
MKTTQRTFLLTCLLFLGLTTNRYCLAQTQTLLTTPEAPVEMILLQPEEIPVCGTFYLLSDLAQTPAGAPPYPCVPPKAASAPVYQIEDNLFLVDDLAANQSVFESASVNSITAELEEQIQTLVQSVRTARANRAMSLAMFGTEFETQSTMSLAEMYSTDDLWLELVSKTNELGNFVVHPPTAEEGSGVYDLFMTTSLTAEGSGSNGTNWLWLLRTSPGQTNVAYSPLLDEICFFRLARTNDADGDGLSDALEHLSSHTDPDNADENANGIPDGWEWLNFGDLNQPASGDYDGDGISNGSEYGNGSDPNTISFTVIITNEYLRVTSPVLPLNVVTGVPASVAVVVDSTNFTSANWINYSVPQVSVPLDSEGWHDVWVGMRGRLSTSQPTWKWVRLKLDTTPPMLAITNPSTTVIAQSMIQLQGFCPEALASISYDLTNSLGVVSNQQIFVLSRAYDTNAWDFSTNYFQGFDIPVKSGANRITIHAVDFAGNIATTNFTYWLDYSSKTNPPKVNLSWPQNGATICGTTFSWEGWLDDFTAHATASMIANGSSNAFAVVIERDGHFWVDNISLSLGTNTLRLAVTDGAGHLTETNITVIKSSVPFSVSSSFWVKPEQFYTTVYGTLQASNYTVWVNGVKAEINGNSWTANDVPLGAGGLMPVNARAIANGDNGGNGAGGSGGAGAGGSSDGGISNPDSPSALDAQGVIERRSSVYLSDYSYSYQGALLQPKKRRTEHLYSDGTIVDWQENSIWEETTFFWEASKGGSEIKHQTFQGSSDVQPLSEGMCHTEIRWGGPSSSNSYNAEMAGGVYTTYCVNPAWTNYLENQGLPIWQNEAHMKSKSETEGWYSAGAGLYTHEVSEFEFNRDMHSAVKFFTGGRSIPGTKSLYALTADVWEVLRKSSADDQVHSIGWASHGRRKLAAQEASIGSFGHPGPDGYIYVTLPDSATVDLTATVRGLDHYEYSPRYRICDPKIYFNGQDVTGSNVTVVVGQKINLSCGLISSTGNILPANGSCKWTVPGYAISNYIADLNTGIVYSNFPTANSNVVFYWVNGGVKTVSVEIGQPPTKATATFTVYRPSVTFTDMPPAYATNAVIDGVLSLALGDNPGNGAMHFQAAAQFLFCKFVEPQTEGGFWHSMLR